jgi:membrane protein insertase Oxa1/YidC/SpoIIIJ
MFLMKKWNHNPAAAGADAQAQASGKMMDLVMPAMSLFISFGLSGMLGVYWIYQSALGILQTFIISRTMPLPRFTEEEIKEMRKAEKAAEKAFNPVVESKEVVAEPAALEIPAEGAEATTEAPAETPATEATTAEQK